LPRPRRRIVPFGCGVCSSVYGGRPIASLNRLVSASSGQSRSGGRSNVQVQVRRIGWNCRPRARHQTPCCSPRCDAPEAEQLHAVVHQQRGNRTERNASERQIVCLPSEIGNTDDQRAGRCRLVRR